MNKNTAGEINSFVDSVNNLFTEVESWIASTPLRGIRQEIEISEEDSGMYKANMLAIVDEGGKRIADLKPIGTHIIGGNGRIDLNGTIDKVILVNLEEGGPSMTTTITVGGHPETRKIPFYKGIDQQGWYWIEDKRRGKPNLFTKDLFVELLREVSDYEFA